MAKKKSGLASAADGAPAIDIGIDAKDREKVAHALSRLLADTYGLYLKTHNFHWNVEGPMFNTLHQMFMVQYTELWNALDEIAERIRSLGYPAPGTYKSSPSCPRSRRRRRARSDGDGARTRGATRPSRAPPAVRSLPCREGRRRGDRRPADAAAADSRKDRLDAAQPAQVGP
jgi:hypothetical protein